MPETPIGMQALVGFLRDELQFVRLEIDSHTAFMGAAEADPGTLEWSVKATLHDSQDDIQESPWLKRDDIALAVVISSCGERDLTIFQADGLIVDPWSLSGTLFDALDARSADYAHFMPLFVGPDGVDGLDLHPRAEKLVTASFGSRIVIINRARLATAWRGLGGVGRLLTARALDWLAADTRFVAVHPHPIDLDDEAKQDDAQFKPAVDRIRRVWRSLGFRRFNDDIWLLDPGAAAYGRAVKRLSKKLGMT